jgi:hypothetical protein
MVLPRFKFSGRLWGQKFVQITLDIQKQTFSDDSHNVHKKTYVSFIFQFSILLLFGHLPLLRNTSLILVGTEFTSFWKVQEHVLHARVSSWWGSALARM